MKPNHTAKQCFDCLAVWFVLGLALNGSLVGCAAAKPATPAAGAAVPTPPAMQSAPRVFVLNPYTLANNKARLATDKTLAPALEQLVQEANQALKTGALTVVAKTVAPEGGDKHDYVSLSPYWWPDPSKPDGLPYIQRDGQTNPELYTIPDKMALYSIISADPGSGRVQRAQVRAGRRQSGDRGPDTLAGQSRLPTAGVEMTAAWPCRKLAALTSGGYPKSL